MSVSASGENRPDTAKPKSGVERWVDRWIRPGWTTPALAFGELLETTILPWPIEAPLAALMFAHRKKIPLYLAVVVVTTLIGSALMYAAGYYAADEIVGWTPGLNASDLQSYQANYQDNGFWTVVLGGLLPVPWQLVTVSAGAAKFNFAAFLLASFIGRGLRFGLLAAAVAFIGPAAVDFWRQSSKTWKTIIWIAAIAAVIGWTAFIFI